MNHLIIAGTNKAGTTSLFEYLGMHHRIKNSKPKQTLFFMDKSYQRYRTKSYEVHYDDNPSDYYEFFEPNRSTEHYDYFLEATPDYLYSHGTDKRIDEFSRKFNVNVKLIFILRDPIDRMKSWFKYGKQINLLKKDLSFNEYSDIQTDDVKRHMVYSSKESGRYCKYLKPYFDLFSESQLYLVNLDDLKTRPHEVMIKLCVYLNLDPEIYANYEFKIVIKSVSIKNKKVSQLAAVGRRLFRDDLGKLRFEKLYKLLKSVYRKINHGEIVSDDEDISEAHIKTLEKYFADEYALLDKCKLE